MLHLFPGDVWLVVAAQSGRVRDVDAALSTCQSLLEMRNRDAIYMFMAVHRWGEDFWRRALSRVTWSTRVFVSMRMELLRMNAFEGMLREMGNKPWTKREYEAMWMVVDWLQ